MDVTNLVLQLKSKITSGFLDQQALSKAIDQLELGAVESVSLFSQLPSASSNAGRLYYVLYDGLYWSTGAAWISIATSIATYEAWSWGVNNCGQLGDGTVIQKSSPVSVIGGFTDWCQVSAGARHSLGLRSNGTLWSWGCNNIGQLGDNTTVNKSSPVSVVGGFNDWCQVSAGCDHSLGVRTNGTAWAWGCNLSGRLGDCTSTSRSSPVSVVGGFIDWCQVAAGGTHSIGLRTNGTVWAWGANTFGSLGSCNTTSRSSPVSVVGGFTNWCNIAAGGAHSLGVRANGSLWSWGFNNCGQLGDGTVIQKSSPVSVIGGFTDWCQVSSNYGHAVAVRTNGTVWAWGRGSYGQLGNNAASARLSPVSVVGGFTDWCRVTAGRQHSAGLRTNGTIWTWGYNTVGQLGDCTATSKSSPVSVVGSLSWCLVSAGDFQTLGIKG